MNSNQSIKSWFEDEQPRIRLLSKGKESLSNTDLLALVLGSGTRHQNAVELSRSLLKLSNGNLKVLSEMTVEELCKVKGIGQAKAVVVLAALELSKRRALNEEGQIKIIRSSKDVHRYIKDVLDAKNYEEFWIVMLNRRNQIINRRKISEGGISGTLADPKKIFKFALENRTSGLILCHNHPSGNCTPSRADIKLTERIQIAAQQLDIQLIDHLIVTANSYHSFADRGLI